MAATRVPFDLANWVAGLLLPLHDIMGVIILVDLLGGCFVDALAMIMLIALLVCNLILPFFPEIALFLPDLMR